VGKITGIVDSRYRITDWLANLDHVLRLYRS